MATYSNHYKWLSEKFENTLKAHQELGKALRMAGPLSSKNAHLVQLAAAAATKSEGAVHSHTKRALAEGAEPDEIYHALILLTSTIGFPSVAAALSWAREIVEK